MDLQQGEEYLGALCIPLRLQQAAVWGDKAPGGTQKIFSLRKSLVLHHAYTVNSSDKRCAEIFPHQ